MTSRRSFFKKALAMAAVVAVAPQVCLRTKPKPVALQELDLKELLNLIYKIKKQRERFDRATLERLDREMLDAFDNSPQFWRQL